MEAVMVVVEPPGNLEDLVAVVVLGHLPELEPDPATDGFDQLLDDVEGGEVVRMLAADGSPGVLVADLQVRDPVSCSAVNFAESSSLLGLVASLCWRCLSFLLGTVLLLALEHLLTTSLVGKLELLSATAWKLRCLIPASKPLHSVEAVDVVGCILEGCAGVEGVSVLVEELVDVAVSELVQEGELGPVAGLAEAPDEVPERVLVDGVEERELLAVLVEDVGQVPS